MLPNGRSEILEKLTQTLKEDNTLSDLISAFKVSISNEKFPFFECSQCNHRFPYPRVQCPKCQSKLTSIRYSKGEGRIITFTVVYRSGSPAVKVPFVVAIVELSEGLCVTANISYSEKISIGHRVNVKFLDSPRENGFAKKPIFELV